MLHALYHTATPNNNISGVSCDKFVCFLSRRTFCREKHVFVATNMCLLRQNTSFVGTKVCLSQQNFMTKLCLSWQNVCRDTYFCRNKRRVCVFRNKSMLVATKVLSRQTRVCRGKKKIVVTNIAFSRQNFCQNKHTFVATKDEFCRDKHVFVATKMTLVATPANDILQAVLPTAFPRTITQPGAN